jgi:hypothetical protein
MARRSLCPSFREQEPLLKDGGAVLDHPLSAYSSTHSARASRFGVGRIERRRREYTFQISARSRWSRLWEKSSCCAPGSFRADYGAELRARITGEHHDVLVLDAFDIEGRRYFTYEGRRG